MSTLTMNDLTKIGDAELDWEPWQFYQVAAWKGPDGIYIATDSGCSCPTPFDWLKSPDQLTGPLTVEQAIDEIEALGKTASTSDEALRDADVTALIQAVRAA